jgi:DNA-binding transcriptional regulator YiaG
MKFKNNVLDKLTQIEAATSRIQFQVSRGMDQEQILESIDNLKNQIEKTREIISLEQDNFAQQFTQ